ncbi:MAG: leucine-rich repeat domain-containing protein [Prevotella sp.]|nr:leucine-rich repeat domain-containing protein [Prevotella sp.]
MVVPNGVKVIGNAFAEYNYLKSVRIPESVESCHVEAFAHAENYKKLYVPSLDFLYNRCTGTITWTDEIYANGELITDLVYPNDLKEIGKYSFMGYRGLKSVTFSNAMKTIPDLSFYNCPNLQEINLGSGIEVISTASFYLTNTFSITFPASLKKLESVCFDNWGYTYVPKTIKCLGSEPPINPRAGEPFHDPFDVYFGKNTTVYIPEGALKAYIQRGLLPWGKRDSSGELYYNFIEYKPGEVSVNVVEENISTLFQNTNGSLTFADEATKVEIYTIEGAQIYCGIPKTIELSQGCYILVIDGKSVKIKM